MNFFLCTFGHIYLGIPSERTERVIPLAEKDDNASFISLPHLFECGGLEAAHGIVLKSEGGAKKTTLLVPPLDIDIDVPNEDIFPIPEVFGGKWRYLTGAFFIERDKEERLIFILDTEKLLKDYQ